MGGKTPLDARGVLDKTEAVLKQIKTIEYRFVQRGHKDAADTPPKMEGRVVLAGPAKNMWVEKFRLDVKIRKPGELEAENLTAGSDGDTVYLVDEKQKKVHADMDPAVLGSRMFTILEAVISNFVNPDPFEYEKKAEAIELKEPVEIGDEPCHVLRFRLGGGTNEIVWFVAQRDMLPRRIDWVFQAPGGEAMGASTVLSEIRVNPTFSSDPFKLAVPAGFTKTDEFAP